MPIIAPPSIVFVRHAFTEWNIAKITMGQADIPASEDGLEIAALNANQYFGTPSWIVSSPLKRALSTSRIFSRRTGLHVQIKPIWVERNWGRYQGMHKSIRPKSGYVNGIEPWEGFLTRVTDGLKNLPHGGEGMLISHSGVFKALLALGYKSKLKENPIAHAYLSTAE